MAVDLSTPRAVEDFLAEDHWMTIHSIHEGVVDLALHCASVTDLCRLWEECAQGSCYVDDDPADTSEHVRHGVLHRFDGQWMIPTDQCVTSLNVHSILVDRILMQGYEPGTYSVTVEQVIQSSGSYVDARIQMGDWDR